MRNMNLVVFCDISVALQIHAEPVMASTAADHRCRRLEGKVAVVTASTAGFVFLCLITDKIAGLANWKDCICLQVRVFVLLPTYGVTQCTDEGEI